MKLIRIGVDLAKDVFQVHGVDRHEKAVWRRKLRRNEWLKVLVATVEPGCEIGMEACGGAHHWVSSHFPLVLPRRAAQALPLLGKRGQAQFPVV